MQRALPGTLGETERERERGKRRSYEARVDDNRRLPSRITLR